MRLVSRCEADLPDEGRRHGTGSPPDGSARAPLGAEPGVVVVAWHHARKLLATTRGRWVAGAGVCITAIGALLAVELRTSQLQARWLAPIALDASFTLARGPSEAIRFPDTGPYDWRLGYARLPTFLERLDAAGYIIDAQARSSPGLLKLIDLGLYPVYDEKSQAGLRILDQAGSDMFQRLYPERVYGRFDDIPPLVVQTLLFLENRELLDDSAPYRNHAIEWDRLIRAGLNHGVRVFDPSRPRLGGSTLATQLEKIRHSPGGVTGSPGEKLKQIGSASVRAYLYGEQTLEAQRRTVTAYLNSLPLAAAPGYGEVIGLGDGLWAWYAADFESVNHLLRNIAHQAPHATEADALAYRQVLNLLVAIRRPSDYLLRHPDQLTQESEALLLDLERAGIVTPHLSTLTRAAVPTLRRTVDIPTVSFVDHKPTTAIRAALVEWLGLETTYEVDRLDMTATSTLHQPAQAAATAALTQLADPDYLAAAGLRGERLLDHQDPARVVFSLILYEHRQGANLLRVHTDSLNQPLNVNDSTKLELGSTAKLRTLTTYLEIVAKLHAEHAGGSSNEIAAAKAGAADPLTDWVLDQLSANPDMTLPSALEAALERQYAASPHESFVTGGGVHTFANYDSDHDGRMLTVREGFRHSINLVFIRVMRDLVRHHVVRLPDWSPTLLDDRADPTRDRYLERFADREGRMFLNRFLQEYEGLSGDEAMSHLMEKGPQTATRVAAIYRTVQPTTTLNQFAEYLRSTVDPSIEDTSVIGLFDAYQPGRWTLADLGVLARAHPLEVWLVADRASHPKATRTEVMARSRDARQQSYRWLFRTNRKRAQDTRIREELERDAFERLHGAWRRLGYPFDRLVPSYATAIGSSGDKPAGLAELMGIIQNDGRRYPSPRVTLLRFGEDTPTETWLRPRVSHPDQLVDPAVAAALRRELVGVVEHGTGRRAAGSIVRSDGSWVETGGKTGTGDNRVEVRRSPASGRVLNRTATFAFLFGDRFYGVITAYVDGAEAESYQFTSALPVQVFKHLIPDLLPLLESSLEDEMTGLADS